MASNTIVSLTDPVFRDELSDLVRDGARRIIAQAVEAGLNAFLNEHAESRDALGRRAVVRNGHQNPAMQSSSRLPRESITCTLSAALMIWLPCSVKEEKSVLGWMKWSRSISQRVFQSGWLILSFAWCSAERVWELRERVTDRAASAAVGGEHGGVALEAGVAAEGAGADHQREIGVHGHGQRDDDGHGRHDNAPEGSAGEGD